MDNKIEKSKSFEERMKERIKESIGDMITDEELSKIVSVGIHTAFFEPQMVKNNWGSMEYKNEPLIVNIVKECVRPQVEIEIKNWFIKNPEVLIPIIDEVIKNGLTKIIFEYFENTVRNSLNNFKYSIEDDMKRILNK